MNRYCYCSKVLPGKAKKIRKFWAEHDFQNEEMKRFWDAIHITQFHSWLQGSQYYIHCVEAGEDLNEVFEEIHIEIKKETPYALSIRSLYTDVIGKDYFDISARPRIEQVFDLECDIINHSKEKKGFVFPLLEGQKEAYLKFCQESMNEKRYRHEAFMRVLGISRLTTWIQTCGEEQYIVCYSERQEINPDPNKIQASKELNEVIEELMVFTGLANEELTPNVEWLTHKDECVSLV